MKVVEKGRPLASISADNKLLRRGVLVARIALDKRRPSICHRCRLSLPRGLLQILYPDVKEACV